MNTVTKSIGGHPLLSDELPEKLQNVYDISSQRIEFSEVRGKKVMTIIRICPECKKRDRIGVTLIREALKVGTLTGLCRQCNARQTKPVPKGNKSSQWKGGKHITPFGYIMLHRPDHPNAQNGYVQEHRLVMEEYLSRYLLPTETVHHKNGNKSDNQIENLELWSCNHSNGQRYEDFSIHQLEQLIDHLQQLLAKKKTQ